MLCGREKGVVTFHPRIGEASIKISWARRSFAGSGGLAEVEEVAIRDRMLSADGKSWAEREAVNAGHTEWMRNTHVSWR